MAAILMGAIIGLGSLFLDALVICFVGEDCMDDLIFFEEVDLNIGYLLALALAALGIWIVMHRGPARQ